MKTRKYLDQLIRRIMESGGLTEDMVKDIDELRDSLDEREGILRKYGKEWDEESDEFEFQEKDDLRVSDGYKDKYETLKKQYIDRFFGEGESDPEKAKKDTEDDVKDDSKAINASYDDVFEDRKEK